MTTATTNGHDAKLRDRLRSGQPSYADRPRAHDVSVDDALALIHRAARRYFREAKRHDPRANRDMTSGELTLAVSHAVSRAIGEEWDAIERFCEAVADAAIAEAVAAEAGR